MRFTLRGDAGLCGLWGGLMKLLEGEYGSGLLELGGEAGWWVDDSEGRRASARDSMRWNEDVMGEEIVVVFGAETER